MFRFRIMPKGAGDDAQPLLEVSFDDRQQPTPWRQTAFGRFWLGDSIYRAANRRVVGALLAENRRLRHGQPPTLITMLARAFDSWLTRRYPAPPPVVLDDD
jgi:hypothetical protein